MAKPLPSTKGGGRSRDWIARASSSSFSAHSCSLSCSIVRPSRRSQELVPVHRETDEHHHAAGDQHEDSSRAGKGLAAPRLPKPNNAEEIRTPASQPLTPPIRKMTALTAARAFGCRFSMMAIDDQLHQPDRRPDADAHHDAHDQDRPGAAPVCWRRRSRRTTRPTTIAVTKDFSSSRIAG